MLLELSEIGLGQTDTKVNEVVGRCRLDLAPAPGRLDGFLDLVRALLARRSVNASGEDEPYEESQRLHPGESEQIGRSGAHHPAREVYIYFVSAVCSGCLTSPGERDTRHVLAEKTSFTSDIVHSFPRAPPRLCGAAGEYGRDLEASYNTGAAWQFHHFLSRRHEISRDVRSLEDVYTLWVSHSILRWAVSSAISGVYPPVTAP